MTQLSRRTILKAGVAGLAASTLPGIAFARAKDGQAALEKAAKEGRLYDAIVIGAGAAVAVAGFRHHRQKLVAPHGGPDAARGQIIVDAGHVLCKYVLRAPVAAFFAQAHGIKFVVPDVDKLWLKDVDHLVHHIKQKLIGAGIRRAIVSA